MLLQIIMVAIYVLLKGEQRFFRMSSHCDDDPFIIKKTLRKIWLAGIEDDSVVNSLFRLSKQFIVCPVKKLFTENKTSVLLLAHSVFVFLLHYCRCIYMTYLPYIHERKFDILTYVCKL